MKILYFDCGMGAAGDMLTAALLELLPQPEVFIEKLNTLGIPGVVFQKEKSTKCGIIGTHVSVQIHGEVEDEHHLSTSHVHTHHHHESGHSHEHHSHSHRGLHEIEHIISHFPISDRVKKDIYAVYTLIAEAESHAHGVPVSQIHFHEVGNMDAIADVTAVCMLMNEIAPDEVVVSPIHVGWGQVKCAHGILPVPAPATAYILRNCPVYATAIKGELCTPTGAALLKHFATRFGEMPMMTIQKIGYGMGKKDFEKANCVRAMFGEIFNTNIKKNTDSILELSCNVDDMTGEAIGYAMEQFFVGGALDVYTIPIGMKKSRPGTLIRVMCKEIDKDKMLHLIFKHTTTLGIRETLINRHVLHRTIETVETPYGDVRKKCSEGYGIHRSKYEYDDLVRISQEHNLTLHEVLKMLP